MRAAVVLAAAWVIPTLTCAEESGHTHDHHKMEAVSPTDPPIKITINPEARVSAVMAGALPAAAPCGTPTELPVKIVNQGFVTAQLEAEIVGEAPAGVSLTFHPELLKGTPEEIRKLHITLTKPGPTDITVAFKARNEIPDLGGRNRVHFLLQCK